MVGTGVARPETLGVYEALKELPIVPHSNGEWSTPSQIFGSTWEGSKDGFPMLNLPEMEVVTLS
jgi:hypothetical protein